MSTTHIQPLPNVRGRMSYTELGEGKKRTRNIREKTNRIAAQMGDMGTREDFIRFCSAMRRQSQGTRLNEGYELRVSWSPEELSKDRIVLLATHIVSDIESIADEVLLMKRGCLLNVSSPAELIKSLPPDIKPVAYYPSLEDVYLYYLGD